MFGECHGHIFMNGVNYKNAVEAHKNGVDREIIKDRLAAYRDAGVSFFREGGDYLGVASYAKSIAPEYGIDYRTPVFAIHKKGHYGGIVGLEYESEKDFYRLVKRAAGEGADFIKIMFSGLIDFHIFGRITGEGLPLPEMKELVHICHEEGFSVMVHVNGRETVHHAIESGVDSIEHGAFITSEELQMMAETRTVWTPTLSPIGNLRGKELFPEEALNEILTGQLKLVSEAFRLGVPVALGSDAGAVTVPHVEGIRTEYKYLLQAAEQNEMELNSVLETTEALVKRRFIRGGNEK